MRQSVSNLHAPQAWRDLTSELLQVTTTSYTAHSNIPLNPNEATDAYLLDENTTYYYGYSPLYQFRLRWTELTGISLLPNKVEFIVATCQ